MNNREAMQKAFEANYKPHEKDFSVFDVDDCKDYTNPNTEKAYAGFVIGYQAALASQAQQPTKNKADELWNNEKLMSLNAELGLSMDSLVNIADAMQSQSQSQQTKIQWKPIETAPKDFITVFDGWNGERVTDVFWGHPDYAEKGVYDWVKSEYVQGFGNEYHEYQRVANLTHWMPLPPAPEGGDK